MGRNTTRQMIDGKMYKGMPQNKRDTLPVDELIQLVAQVGGLYRKDVEPVLNAYYKVLYSALMNGYKVHIPRVCMLTTVTQEPKEPFERVNGFTGEMQYMGGNGAYWKPKAVFKPAFKDALREKTEGNVPSRIDFCPEDFEEDGEEDD